MALASNDGLLINTVTVTEAPREPAARARGTNARIAARCAYPYSARLIGGGARRIVRTMAARQFLIDSDVVNYRDITEELTSRSWLA